MALPDPPLIFLVFELRRWPGYQKCSKMFKVFDFFGFEWIWQALKAKNPYCLEKLFSKNAILLIFGQFWGKFVACSTDQNQFCFHFLNSPKPGEHFSYPHDVSSTPRSRAMRAWKIKILEKKLYFFKILKKNVFSKFFFLLSPFPDPPLIFLVFELRKWPGYQKCSKMFKVFEFFGFESKVLFYKRLWLLAWKKNFKKMRFFRFLSQISNMFWTSELLVFPLFGFPEVRRALFIPSWCFWVLEAPWGYEKCSPYFGESKKRENKQFWCPQHARNLTQKWSKIEKIVFFWKLFFQANSCF